MVASYTEDINPENYYGDLRVVSRNTNAGNVRDTLDLSSSDEKEPDSDHTQKPKPKLPNPNTGLGIGSSSILEDPLQIFMEKSTKSKKVKHSKSKHKKSSTKSTSNKNTLDFEHFLNGTAESEQESQGLDLSAYEAL